MPNFTAPPTPRTDGVDLAATIDDLVQAAVERVFADQIVDRRPSYLDSNSALAYSGLSKTTLNELIRSERISVRKFGSKNLVERESLDRYLRSLPAWGTQTVA
ncbi:hypothetical protein NONO_c73230 [Nocardia nova SH22a]|uniref:Helix-turn-helix domain-containing protein n=1 Tax=Nocardia nova SH22a TaxID=1415166 RepID=W5TSD9_9NOCA|nr:helix-turn-helix domain-containing protein [Nocardia nova]AHH22079.1 hypothetical protein NONO_c73230 [Nocardia nova SH22a]